MGKKAESICEKIREAFCGVALGNGVGLEEAQGLDGGEDEEACAKLRLEDEIEDWTRISSCRLNACHSSLSFFDAEGMRFHLPAYLIADLKGEYGFHLDFSLTHLSDYNKGQFASLSAHQREAVREYLRFIFEEPDYLYERPYIEGALLGFWSEDRDE
ncbi:hypothetical protein OKA04_17235 [Luteolibacter flavescens]|uniref:Uncharacterized protein n=1 Tax=Luteolibacter flavescens TaxID=1859460 RepID=A0ABT3FSE2_9BACT|nr:DUF6714 family protein [Luteolibacter flavescens]MCW1886485.1 hypothetical protein [Luteolibacter flavescens]